jgi:UDP-N-acetylmuramate dehydrogenase
VIGTVIKNSLACRELELEGKYLKVGSSVPLQKLVIFCLKNNLYGMEYLFSVPGNVGGAICMNAGRGEQHKQSISDHVVSVEIFDGQRIEVLSNEQCRFGYRSSIFQKRQNWIVLSALLDLPKQNKEIGFKKIKERTKIVRETQDRKYPNAGTVFKKHFRQLPEIIGYRIGNAQFSTKTPGWIINLGGATYKDVQRLIKYAMHRSLNYVY